MLRSTTEYLCCPHARKGVPCRGGLEIISGEGVRDVEYGTLECRKCRARFPVVAGVAVLVRDVEGYFLHHVKGIAKAVPDDRIPSPFRSNFLELRDELEDQAAEHIEEDLESDRVNALYLMTHYLRVAGVEGDARWWTSGPASESPVVTEWIQKYWDHGPLSRVSGWIPEGESVVELGCGVGGLLPRIAGRAKRYLGVDSSFQSIRIARHLNLDAGSMEELRIPADLFSGSLSRPLGVLPRNVPGECGMDADFVVGELESLPLPEAGFDGSVCLNAIDMLDEPKVLPDAQARIIPAGGFAIQCAPYIWHEKVARGLRGRVPRGVSDSLSAVEWLYEKAGFEIVKSEPHIPWLFFKHLRQIELYSVHGFFARKST
jgi:SAM-dependent methyltransferase